MSDRTLLVGLFVAAWLGFALLALSQTRHWRQVTGTVSLPTSQVIVLRLTGGLMIIVSFVLSLLRDGPSFGVLLWAAGISLAALAVALMLAWQPGWLRLLGRGVSCGISFSYRRRNCRPRQSNQVQRNK